METVAGFGRGVVIGSAVAALVFFTVAGGLWVGRGWVAYLNDPRLPKPPLGWSPWTRPTLRRRLAYHVRRAHWRLRTVAARTLVRVGAKRTW